MMTYKKAGVNRTLGDRCSEIAYAEAKKTFIGRAKMIGEPLKMDGGFTGALDMGDFLIVQNEDGVGTKIEIAERMNDFSTLGADLVAMVADDAVCAGAEVISITNTIDTAQLNSKVVSQMMKGLAKVCLKQHIVIPGGEIAELKGHVNGYTWNSTAVGIVEKKKFITGAGIKPGDKIIGILSPNFRSNGYTLLRAILKKSYGANWHKKTFMERTWGAIALEPSIVYHAAMLGLIGRYGKPARVRIKGIAHITGGGLPGNVPRMFGVQKAGAMLDNLPPVPAAMKELIRIGGIADREAYETWNMGVGMAFIAYNPERAIALLKKSGLKAQIIGCAIKEPKVYIKTDLLHLFIFS